MSGAVLCGAMLWCSVVGCSELCYGVVLCGVVWCVCLCVLLSGDAAVLLPADLDGVTQLVTRLNAAVLPRYPLCDPIDFWQGPTG